MHFETKFGDDIMAAAKKERINQLTGSNQNSVLQLLRAYLKRKEDDENLKKDYNNLLNLSKRITVLKYLQKLDC